MLGDGGQLIYQAACVGGGGGNRSTREEGGGHTHASGDGENRYQPGSESGSEWNPVCTANRLAACTHTHTHTHCTGTSAAMAFSDHTMRFSIAHSYGALYAERGQTDNAGDAMG